VGLEAVGFSMDSRGALAVRRVDQAEDLALLLGDPVLLVVDAVLTLDAHVGLVRFGDILGLDAGDVVDVHYVGICDLLFVTPSRSGDPGASDERPEDGGMTDVHRRR
jgi:hypothetical protein